MLIKKNRLLILYNDLGKPGVLPVEGSLTHTEKQTRNKGHYDWSIVCACK